MLHELPGEILQIITDKLSFEDKLNLCETCRSLYEKISKTNLYTTLKIRENAEDVIKMFQSKILDGSQVHILDIILDHLSDDLYSSLVDIFPNVTRFMPNAERICDYGNLNLTEERKRESHIIKPLLRYKDTLKHYEWVDDWMHFRSEMFCSVFPRLEGLVIWDSIYMPGRGEGFDPLFLTKCITNAPMLTCLSLGRCDISMDSLEKIHNECPYISSLELNHVILIVDNNSLPLPIVPAKSVFHLELDAKCIDKYALFLDYIIYKYPNLQDLKIGLDNSDISDNLDMLFEYYPNFEHDGERVTITENSGEHDRICEKRLDELKLTIKAYETNGPSFLSRLPKSIRSLFLDLNIFENAIEILSKNNIVLSTLELKGYDADYNEIYVDSHQLEYIKHLKSLKTLDVRMHSSVQSCKIDCISNVITTLEIKLIESGFYIEWIISNFPSLEILVVYSSEYLLTDEKVSNSINLGITYPRLRKLDLWNCKVHPESLSFLQAVLPNVQEFKWAIYVDHGLNYNVDLTGWNSDRLDVSMAIRKSDSWLYCNIIISTPTNIQPILYKGNSFELDQIQDESEFIEGATRINITYNCIKSFRLNRKKLSYRMDCYYGSVRV